VELDLEHAALGTPLSDAVWDVYAAMRWEGQARGAALTYRGPARAALIDGRAAVAYRGTTGRLSVDTAGRLRNVVKDARPTIDDVAGTVRRLVVALPDIAITGSTELPATVALTPLAGVGPDVELHGSVIGGPDGARLDVAGAAPPGCYRLAFGVGRSGPLQSVFVAQVDDEGEFEVIRRPLDQAPEPSIGRLRSWAGRTWRLGAASARAAARRVRSRR